MPQWPCAPSREGECAFLKAGGSQSPSSSGRSLRSDSRLAMEAVPLMVSTTVRRSLSSTMP